MKRFLLWVFAFLLAAAPALADSQGSATGGTAGTQSTLNGGLCLTSPSALANGQQAAFLIDCTTHALVIGGGSGGAPISVNIAQIGGATAVNPTANTGVVGSAVQRITPALDAGCNKTIAVSQTTSTDLHTMVNTGYICSVILVTADAEVLDLIEGTGSTCGTGSAAIIGSTTNANGMSFAANGGVSAPSPYTQFIMVAAADHLCLTQSGSGRVAGVITYRDN